MTTGSTHSIASHNANNNQAQFPEQANNQSHPGYPLGPIDPSTAVEMYLADRDRELRDSSLTTHESALKFFEQWCEEEGIDNLNELTGRLLHQYRIWRRDDATTKVDTLSKKSVKTQQDIIRSFIAYCESIDGVRPGLHEQVRSPTIRRDEAARDACLEPERAKEILDHLTTFQYGSLEHVVWKLLTDHGPRTGAIHALDVEDYFAHEDPPHLAYRHRPESGTGLKKGTFGERLVSLSDSTCDVIDAYLEHHRESVTDEHGRNPLLTGQGRLSKSTIRKYVYKWTRPCAIGRGCPHNRDEDSCEATTASSASKCPSSLSAHSIRRGYITHELNAGVDRSYIAERCSVSEEIIKLHYDERDEQDRLQVRHWALQNARRTDGEYSGGR